MTQDTNRQIVLAARPVGAPKDSDFRLVEAAVPEPGAGEILCRTLYLSLDPYMRGRMNASKSYAASAEIDQVMVGGAVSEVLRSDLADFKPGDIVFAYSGWQDCWTSDGRGARKVDPALAPISTALGVLGMPGMTAYTGLRNIGQPKKGETLVVAAASGPVGSLVGQIGKIEGCRAVGVAGSAEKCAACEKLGAERAINYREEDFVEVVKDLTGGEGVDVILDMVGGDYFAKNIKALRIEGRLVCIAFLAGSKTEFDFLPMMLKRLSIMGSTLRPRSIEEKSVIAQELLREVWPLLDSGQIGPLIDSTFPLARACDAHSLMESSAHIGKIMLTV